MQKLDAEVLTVGDELNRGEIVDTNSSWLAERLTGLGLHVRWRSSVTDDEPDMIEALKRAAGRARVVCVSGGLGPTDDDRTVDVAARLVGVEPVIDEAHEAAMQARFGERNFRVTPNNLRQVRVPAGAEVLRNQNGLAPGFRIAVGDSELYFMPGVPREMKLMFDSQIVRRLEPLERESLRTVRRTWRVAGMGESHVDHALKGLLDGIAGATLHFRISFPENLVTVVVRHAEEAAAQATLERVDADVRGRLGEHLYGVGDETLPAAVGARLRRAGATLALAESCTGGLVGQLITSVPGSSEYFRGAAITYADDVKAGLLGVHESTLAAHGAVSRETVLEMAEGARRIFRADWSAAISGVAGPGGGTPEKPVGTIEVAVRGPGDVVEHRHLLWPGERELVRQIAAFAALHLLYKALSRV